MIRDFTPEFDAQQDELLKQQRWAARAEELRQQAIEAERLRRESEHTPVVPEKAQR